MSDLTATNCGGGCGCGSCGDDNNCLFLILILLFCGGGCGTSAFSNNGCGNDSCLFLILLLFFCGGFGSNGCNSCGCGNNVGLGC